MVRWFYFWIICSLLLLASCDKDQSVEPSLSDLSEDYVLLDCNDPDQTRLFFAGQVSEEILVKAILEDDSLIIFQYEDESAFAFPTPCFNQVVQDPDNWTATLFYADGTEQTIGRIGKLSIVVDLNPSGYNPLAAELTVSAPFQGSVEIRVHGLHGAASDVQKHFTTLSTNHLVPVLGLYPLLKNVVDITYYGPAGHERTTESIDIVTGPIPDNLPPIEILTRQADKMEPGWNFVSYRYLSNPNIPFMFDQFGDIRWVLDYSDHAALSNLGYDVGIERLQNGNLYFGDWTTNYIYEVDMFGRQKNKWYLSGYSFHHNVQEKPNGNFLATASKAGSFHLNGNQTIEDYILEIDRTTGDLITVWDLKESLDEYRTALTDQLEANPIDWIHVNAVIPDPTDNTIIVSGRTQALVKLDYSNQVKWIMGPHLGWGENRFGQDLNQFLLTAITPFGNELPADFQNGIVNYPGFEWNWYQHAPLILPNGNIMLFDNGFNRNFEWSGDYSRAVEYQIDETAMTVQQVWEYGRERGPETFSHFVSDVDLLPETGNVLFCPGYGAENGKGDKGGRIVELDYSTQEVYFDAFLISPGITFHRSERMTIYPE